MHTQSIRTNTKLTQSPNERRLLQSICIVFCVYFFSLFHRSDLSSTVFSGDSCSFLPPKQEIQKQNYNEHDDDEYKQTQIHSGTNTNAVKLCMNYDTAGHQCQCIRIFFLLNLSFVLLLPPLLLPKYAQHIPLCLSVYVKCAVFIHEEFIGGLL